MPGSDHFPLTGVLLSSAKVFHTTIDAPNLPRHRRRYGLTEIRDTRGDTGKIKALQDRFISFHEMESRQFGKGTSRGVTASPASLHTYHMY